MKNILSIVLIAAAMVACSHKKMKGEDYSPITAFDLEGKKFSAIVQLPKKFDKKVPLVVIVHEWWGRNNFMSEQSQKITENGYATLAVDLFGNGVVVENPKDAQDLATPFYKNPQLGIDRLNKFIDLAKKDPHVDADKIYVIGYCFGGTQALNLARSGADIKGVVSFHGGLASSLPQKTFKARVLALNGLADPFVPAKERQAFEKEMKAVKADYKIVNYKGATHAFTNPHSTAVGKKFKIPVAYDQKAAEASFSELMDFLKK